MPALLEGKEADFLEAVPDAIVVVDEDGRIVFVNATARELFGYAKEVCLGQSVEMLLPQRYRAGHEVLREGYRVALRRRLMPDGQDLTARNSDGHEIPVDISLGPMQTDGRTLVIAVIRDVSDRRRVEDALRRSEERFRLLAENADDIIYRRRFADPPAVEYINPAVEGVLGYRPDEFYADPDLMLKAVHPDDRAPLMEFRRDPGSFHGTTTFRFIAKTGQMRWIQQRFALINDDDGVPVAIQSIARDVTDATAAEEALRESEARLAAAIDHLPALVWAYDADGRCFLQNGACKEVWGDRTGRMLDDAGLPDDERAFWEDVRSRVMAGEVVVHEDRFSQDSQQRLYYTIVAPIVTGGEVTGVLGISIDVTEQRQAQALEVELRAAQESERLKDALLSTVSHELRTPISAVLGYATLAIDFADRLASDELLQYFGDIKRYAQQLERLVTDLLTMSRIEAGVLVIDPKPVDAESLMSESVEAFTGAGGKRDVNVSILQPGMKMMVDGERIRQVLLNLFDNADKYSEPDTSIDVVADRQGGQVRLRVRDHGRGVPEVDLDRIFGRFYRVDDRSSVRGTGLGLAICRSIIEGHGGSIQATLPPDGGLEITLLLPAA